MKLPAGDQAIVDIAKLRDYCLDPQHPRGQGARVRQRPDPLGSYARLVSHVKDRPGHDRRYAIDARKIERELGWNPVETFETGIRKTVRWYLDHAGWVEHVQSGAYRDWVAAHYDDRPAR